jgi:hypothetical protein
MLAERSGRLLGIGPPAVNGVTVICRHKVEKTVHVAQPTALRTNARVTDGLDQPEVTTAEAMKRLASVPLGYEYSLATDVLGAVIEKATGGRLEAFVTERIAKPLRIHSGTRK